MHPLLPLLLWHMGRQAHGLGPAPMPPDWTEHVQQHPLFQGFQGGGSLGAPRAPLPQPQPGGPQPMYGGIGGLLQAVKQQQPGNIAGALAPYMPAMGPNGRIA